MRRRMPPKRYWRDFVAAKPARLRHRRLNFYSLADGSQYPHHAAVNEHVGYRAAVSRWTVFSTLPTRCSKTRYNAPNLCRQRRQAGLRNTIASYLTTTTTVARRNTFLLRLKYWWRHRFITFDQWQSATGSNFDRRLAKQNNDNTKIYHIHIVEILLGESFFSLFFLKGITLRVIDIDILDFHAISPSPVTLRRKHEKSIFGDYWKFLFSDQQKVNGNPTYIKLLSP